MKTRAAVVYEYRKPMVIEELELDGPREKDVLRCYYGSGDMRIDLKTLLELYKNGRLKIDELITNWYGLDGINRGFDDLEPGKNARGVVMY